MTAVRGYTGVAWLLLAALWIFPGSPVGAAQDPYAAATVKVVAATAANGAVDPAKTATAKKPGLLSGYSVPYDLRGMVSIHEQSVILNTPDGRVFQLWLDANKARLYQGRQVRVEGLARQADDVTCIKVKKITLIDPKAPEVVLPPYKAAQRPPSLLRSDNGALVIKDFRWSYGPVKGDDSRREYVWDTVTLRPDLVENVYFVKKPFAPEWLAAHSLLLYTFKPGGLVNSKGEESRAFVLSIEAYQRTDQKYDLVAGLKKTFGCVWILATWQDYLDTCCKYADEKLIAYKCILDHAQKEKLVRETVRLSVVNRQGEYYHTITNNCTNNLVVLLNHVLEKKRQVKMWWLPSMIYNFRATMPVIVPPMLIKRGIVGKELPEINKGSYDGEANIVP